MLREIRELYSDQVSRPGGHNIGPVGLGSFQSVGYHRPGGNNMSALGFGSFRSMTHLDLMSDPPNEDRLHLSLELGDQCNLHCAHCIYDDGLKRRPIPDDLLVARLHELISAGIRPTYGTFAGKEPSLFARAKPEMFQKMAGLMAGPATVRIMMTNGLLLGEQMGWLPEYIDCLDVSLDGDEAEHDRNRRRPGAFRQTWDNLVLVAKKFREVGIIATATSNPEAPTADGILALQQRLAKTFDPNGNVGLSLSLYYDRPGCSYLLKAEELIALFKTLQAGPFPVRVLWTANYAHLTDPVLEALGCDGIGYDRLTGLPLLTSGSLELVAFNLLLTPTVSLRIATDGLIYEGCNYLTYGHAARWSAIGDITSESLVEIYRRVQRQTKLVEIPEVCRGRDCTALCRGGDLSTGRLEHRQALDPYCAKIGSRRSGALALSVIN